jgi:predicted metal-dependent phosphoesterase TrpH
MIRLEFHCHTVYSKDSLTRPEALIAACRTKDIQRLVITDHNTIGGAQRAREIAPELVVMGEEIMTTQGELLAAFVQEEIPAGLPPEEAIRRLREQGAFISVSHPFDVIRKGHWETSDLERIVPLVDAIETFNARCMRSAYNHQARRFASQYGLPGTAGSDAHTAFELGKAAMLLPDFQDAASLREALPQARFQASLSAPWVHLTSRYAVWKKKLARLGD